MLRLNETCANTVQLVCLKFHNYKSALMKGRQAKYLVMNVEFYYVVHIYVY